MRTRVDLEAAFALIADEAEEYLASDPATQAGTSPRSRPNAQWLLVAAAVVLLGLGLLFVRAQFSSDGARQTGGDDVLPMRSALFTMTHSPHVTLKNGWNITTDEQVYQASVDGHDYEITVDTQESLQASGYPFPNTDPATAERVNINGYAGYLGCSGHSSDPPVCGPTKLTLAWMVRNEDWVQIFGSNTPADRDRMLRLARALDFTRMAALHSPVAVDDAPDGLSLVEFAYGKGAQIADWDVVLTYSDQPAREGSHNAIDIVVSQYPVPTNRKNGQALTIDGHQAWFEPGARLYVDAGGGRTIMVRQSSANLDTLTKIERTVHIAPHADEPNSWPSALTALP